MHVVFNLPVPFFREGVHPPGIVRFVHPFADLPVMAYLFIVVLVDGFQGAPVNSEGRKAGIVAAGRQVVDTDVDAQAAPLVLLFVRDFYIVDQLDDDPVFVWDQAGLLEGAEVFPLCESRGDCEPAKDPGKTEHPFFQPAVLVGESQLESPVLFQITGHAGLSPVLILVLSPVPEAGKPRFPVPVEDPEGLLCRLRGRHGGIVRVLLIRL